MQGDGDMTKDAFTAQLPRLRDQLLRQARRHVASDLAEDLVQETLYQTCRRLDVIEGDAGPWAMTVLRRLIGHLWRDARPQESLIDARAGAAVEIPVAANQEMALDAGKAL